MELYFAHSENANGIKEPLPEHLKITAELASRYASSFGEEHAGAWLGWFHDAGKASALFQGVLKGTEHNVNHAAAGAFLMYHNKQYMLSRVIYAHHDGLQWGIQSDLERSVSQEKSQDSKGGKRFSDIP